MDRPKTAYITGTAPLSISIESLRYQNPTNRCLHSSGGASGIARALTLQLLSQGWHVFISDRNVELARQFAYDHNSHSNFSTLHYAECDTTSWDSQLSAFQAALKTLGGRIDFVAPIAGIGEKKWLPSFEQMGRRGPDEEFAKPDLGVIDVDLTGVLYTIALAVQQFQRQDPAPWSANVQHQYRGKIGLVASVCGFYCVPSLPIYTAAKHALIGLTRSYGALLKDESITLSALAPNVVRTSISSSTFYDQMEKQGLLTPMESVLEAFNDMVEGNDSGAVYECGPDGRWSKRPRTKYLDAKSEQCCDLLFERARGLHYGIEKAS
jgi:NAD(P)-dependent dehydrogenase (short-subunit alcohol dehydrogenase family)